MPSVNHKEGNADRYTKGPSWPRQTTIVLNNRQKISALVVLALVLLGGLFVVQGRRTPVGVVDVSYRELTAMIADSALVVGNRYRLTDFRTRHTVPYTDVVHEGRTEALILTANGVNSLDMVAVSAEYPHDRIHYTYRNDLLYVYEHDVLDQAVDRGVILYREDTVRHVEAWEDFRNVKFRRWETAAGNGIYAYHNPAEAPPGARYQDFPMFADYSATSEVSIDHHRNNNRNGGSFLSNIVFRGVAYKVFFPDGAVNATFLKKAQEVRFGFCAGGTFYDTLLSVDFSHSSNVISTGTLERVYIRKQQLTVNGDLKDVEVLGTFGGDVISGDYTNKVFGIDHGISFERLQRKPTYATDFNSGTTATANPPFVGTPVLGGSVATAVGLVDGDHPGVVGIGDSTDSNSGYRFLTDIEGTRIGGGEVFDGVINVPALAETTVRLGFLDTTTADDAVDGCYFEIHAASGEVIGKCASNAMRTSTAGSYPLSAGNWYSYRITIDEDAILATFEIFTSDGVPLWQSNNTVGSNLPTAAGRETGVGVIATESSPQVNGAIVYLDFLSVSYGAGRELKR